MSSLLPFVCVVLGMYQVHASLVKLDVSPAIIDVNLTHTLSMNCAMNGGTVSHLVSIVITRMNRSHKEEVVASVSTFDQALAATDMATITVNGTVQERVVANNFLHVEWDHPTTAQASNYSCEINAIDRNSRPVRYSQSVTINSRVPTTEDIVHHVRELEKQGEQQSQLISSLEKLIKALEARVLTLEGKRGLDVVG